MYAFLIDENNKIVGYYPTGYELIKAEVERPNPPENIKSGINYVEYWNPETGKIILKEETRSLTLEERVAAAESKADASMEAIAEMFEQGNQ